MTREPNPDLWHTYPLNDLIEHELEGTDCICGVSVEPVVLEDGTLGWNALHHSLDGREQRETNG